MPRLVHLPLALEGANKVHLISKIHHIIYETLSIFHKTQVIHKAGLSVMSETRST